MPTRIQIVRLAARWFRAVTTPLPSSFPKTEIGLMTNAEFLNFRNPSEKSHSSDAYDFSLTKMNHDHMREIGIVEGRDRSTRYTVLQALDGFLVEGGDGPLAIIHKGMAYYSNRSLKHDIPVNVWSYGNETDLGIKQYKQVKYLPEMMPLISPLARKNRDRFPEVLQHIIVKGEPMTIRAEAALMENAGTTLVILNSQGLIVAQASDEWGATLLTVAQEYRGRGLGKIIGKVWYKNNPDYTSGGFTDSGQANALALWVDRVREFLSYGWYTELVHQGRMTKARMREILSGLGGHRPKERVEKVEQKVKPTGDILVFSDGDTTFVVYDRAFLEEPNEDFIHGYGFFRNDVHVGTFLFTIDYDRPYHEITTKVALQMARDNHEALYDGEGYHDLLELEGISGVERDVDYIKVTKDLFPLRASVQKERRLRRANDPYDEKYHLLLEMAESKWR